MQNTIHNAMDLELARVSVRFQGMAECFGESQPAHDAQLGQQTSGTFVGLMMATGLFCEVCPCVIAFHV